MSKPIHGERLLDELQRLQVFVSRDGRRAVYKYIVLLWGISRSVSGDRLTVYDDGTRDQLRELLRPFAVGKSTTPTPNDPVYRLSRSSWWDVCRDDATGAELVGLSADVHALVRLDVRFLDDALGKIVEIIVTSDTSNRSPLVAVMRHLGLAHPGDPQ